MKRTDEWREFWSFFIGPGGRRMYHKMCNSCIYPCKQSYRVTLISCPKRVEREPRKQGK